MWHCICGCSGKMCFKDIITSFNTERALRITMIPCTLRGFLHIIFTVTVDFACSGEILCPSLLFRGTLSCMFFQLLQCFTKLCQWMFHKHTWVLPMLAMLLQNRCMEDILHHFVAYYVLAEYTAATSNVKINAFFFLHLFKNLNSRCD